MDSRLTAARFAGALASLAFIAACSDHPTAPSARVAPTGSAALNNAADPGNGEVLSNAVIHRTVEATEHARAAAGHRPGGSVEMYYHGGIGGIGVETAPKVYLVIWGSQWNSNDPSGEQGILQNFYGSVFGSSWLNSVTQYCQGVATSTQFCNGAGTAAGNATGSFSLSNVWVDNLAAAPSRPAQSDIAAEAVRAAAHFGNTAAGSNNTTQYVIATATGNSSSGFGTQYCAYHSSTSSTYGNVAYTNLPYLTDAGASCGANYNGLGAKAGITIVGGHEMAETITDQFPNGGWLDGSNGENGDKCAWIASGQGASANVIMPNGSVFPVQSLWSNAFNSNKGGCVLSF